MRSTSAVVVWSVLSIIFCPSPPPFNCSSPPPLPLLSFNCLGLVIVLNKLFSFSIEGFGCVNVKGNSAANSPPNAPAINKRIFTLY